MGDFGMKSEIVEIVSSVLIFELFILCILTTKRKKIFFKKEFENIFI